MRKAGVPSLHSDAEPSASEASRATGPYARSDSGMGDGSDTGSGSGSEAVVSEREPDAPTSPTSPLAPYPPLHPADSRSRAPEFYGFVAWTSTYLLFVLYLLWAFLPDERILALGVSWYPNREWSLLIPAYGMVLVLLTYFTYFALALAGTPAFSDMRTITDSKAHLPPAARDENASSEPASNLGRNHSEPPSATTAGRSNSNSSPYLAHARPDAIPELYDIPLGLVNRVVYGPPRRRRPPSTNSQPRVAS
ncbi:PIG-P-domain-containing protein [Polyporus arcularius HHB13444]|uniref:PIG-P-domain-containing protein n=1 Tax=Polyporus arcularius HHB13444 TaxID=1314778 RepID=A0A5C3PUZ8_9APHY|nr:PIG-P-domain-containing protein [Polyporus arcularius HHB13444]